MLTVISILAALMLGAIFWMIQSLGDVMAAQSRKVWRQS